MNTGLTIAKNEAAVAFLKGKPAVSRQVFDKLLPELKARAFTLTGLEGAANVMQAVRDRIAELPAGAAWDEVKKDVAADISPYLVDPNASDEDRDRQAVAAIRRAELVMRIHGYQAYMAAQHETLERQKDVFTHWQYVTVGDERVRDSHAALDGLVLPADSPFWRDHYPPWEWGCRCDIVPLMDTDVEQVREEDQRRNPENRRVLEGAQLRKLEQDGQITRGPVPVYDPNDPDRKRVVKTLPAATHWVVSPAAEGKEGAFRWNPADLRLTAEELSKRYDPDVWRGFREWAERSKLPGAGENVWDWTFDADRAKAREILLRRGGRLGREAAVALDYGSGASVGGFVEGEKDKVHVGALIGEAKRKGLRISLAHYHPDGGPLSPADFRTLLAHRGTVAEIIAHDAGGERRASLTPNMRVSSQKAFLGLLGDMDTAYKSGKLSLAEWEARVEMWRKNGVIRYEYRPGKR